MKKGKNIVIIAFLTFILSCNNESSPIFGKWKLNNSNPNHGQILLTFFPRNVFTIVYSAKNKMQTQIKNSGIWKLDPKTNIIELINDKGNSIEKYQIQLLNKDSLLWLSIVNDSTNSIFPELFLRKE